MVPGARLELAQAFAHHPLKMACLPVPPSGHTYSVSGRPGPLARSAGATTGNLALLCLRGNGNLFAGHTALLLGSRRFAGRLGLHPGARKVCCGAFLRHDLTGGRGC